MQVKTHFNHRFMQHAAMGGQITCKRRLHSAFGELRVAVQVQQAWGSQKVHLPLIVQPGGKLRCDAHAVGPAAAGDGDV